jgi:hypothetical protein
MGHAHYNMMRKELMVKLRIFAPIETNFKASNNSLMANINLKDANLLAYL